MSTKYPPVSASVDQAAFLSKVDRVFDASPTTVFNELLQNSRRAGATTAHLLLEADTDPNSCRLMYSDDGKGIEDPSILLRLAAKGWEGQVEQTEDPAGMGFFCLSAFREVDITSRDWTAKLTPSVFRGEEPMVPKETGAGITGTIICWAWEELPKSADTLREAFFEASTHCGLEQVKLQFEENVMVRTPQPFIPATCENWRPEGAGYSLAVRPGFYQGMSSYFSRQLWIAVNFHGVKILLIVTNENQMFTALAALNIHVLVDVENVGGLQLVLPARNALKHNEARERLLRECEKAVLLYCSSQKFGNHELPFWVYSRAQTAGIDIGEAAKKLFRTRSAADSGIWMHASSEEMIIRSGEEPDRLWWLLYNNSSVLAKKELVNEREQFAGYSWYDALPQLVDGEVWIDGELLDLSQTSEATDFEKVGKIEIVLKLSNGEMISSKVSAYINSYEPASWFSGSFEYAKFYVSSDAVEKDENFLSSLVDLATNLAFCPSEDSDSDSNSTQEEAFARDAMEYLSLQLMGEEKTAERIVARAIRDLPIWLQRKKIEIKKPKGEDSEITVMLHD